MRPSGFIWTQTFIIEGVGCELGMRGAATKQQMRLEKIKTHSIWEILCHSGVPQTLGFPTIQVYPQKATCRNINHLYGLIGTIGTNIGPLPTPISLDIRNSPNSLALEHDLKFLSAFREIPFLSPFICKLRESSANSSSSLPPNPHLPESAFAIRSEHILSC